MKTNHLAILVIILFFFTSTLISYSIIASITQRTYSIPEYQSGTANNSTQGGEGLTGEFRVQVSLRPNPGSVNISLDTVILLYEMRPTSKDLQVDPKIPFLDIKEEYVALASRETTYYPIELLQPNTVYNISGTISNEPVWWIFTTGSSVTPQTDYKILLPSYTWIVTLATSLIATLVFVKIVWKKMK